jgi:hypothetical protein
MVGTTPSQSLSRSARLFASGLVLLLLAVILIVVVAPWAPANGSASAALLSGEAPVPGGAATVGGAPVAPGGHVTGRLVVANHGGGAGRFTLAARGIVAPGAGDGAAASSARGTAPIVVTLTELRPGASPRVVYRGALSGCSGVDLGEIAGGGCRVFRVDLTLPSETETAACPAGRPVSIAFDWTAVAAG